MYPGGGIPTARKRSGRKFAMQEPNIGSARITGRPEIIHNETSRWDHGLVVYVTRAIALT
jgi:hypothetical protein